MKEHSIKAPPQNRKIPKWDILPSDIFNPSESEHWFACKKFRTKMAAQEFIRKTFEEIENED